MQRLFDPDSRNVESNIETSNGTWYVMVAVAVEVEVVVVVVVLVVVAVVGVVVVSSSGSSGGKHDRHWRRGHAMQRESESAEAARQLSSMAKIKVFVV